MANNKNKNADAAAQAQRQHDRDQQARAHANAMELQRMQAAEAQKSRDFQKKQSAVERANQYATNNRKASFNASQDHTGGAVAQMQGKFGNNPYQRTGSFTKEYDFSSKKSGKR